MSDHAIMVIRVIKTFFVQFFCGFLPPLLNLFCFCLGPYHSCPLLCPSLHETLPCYLQFSWRSLVFPFLLFLFIFSHFHLKRLPYLPLVFFGTLHSVGYTVTFLLCLLLLFSQLFLRSPQTATLPSCISFSWGCV